MLTTPRDLHYRWPAEWERHASTWLAWPHNRETWPGGYAQVPRRFAHLVSTTAQFEPVNVLAGGAAMKAAKRWLGAVDNVELHEIPTNDAWTRDHGPTFLSGGPAPALVDWRYNAWGEKYPPYDLDNAVPEHIAQLTGRRRFVSPLVMEGGSIETDGQGTILTTEQCLLNPNRNPGHSKSSIEQALEEQLNAERVLWLTGGEIQGDDTDGHIDQLARFVSTDTIVAAVETNPNDENYAPLQANYQELLQMRSSQGAAYNIVPLPMPAPKYFSGYRLPCCYANFYIVNGGVIVPQYEDSADYRALGILRDLLPGRQIVGLSAVELAWGLGSFHCMTQQEPAV